MEKDIERAIIAEQEYIQDSDPDHFPLIERVKEFGFETLEEYFYTKVKYQINKENITIQSHPMEETIELLYQYYNDGKSGAFTVREDYNRTWIWAGKDNIYLDVEKAKELNYGIANFSYYGGPIVTTNTDFNLAIIIPNYIDLDSTLIHNKILDLLSSKGYNPILDNNDILIDNKKVVGTATTKNDKMTLYVFSASLSQPNNEVISQLSLKECEKTPGYIDNLTRDEFEEEMNKWLHSI